MFFPAFSRPPNLPQFGVQIGVQTGVQWIMTIRQNHYLEQRGHTWCYVCRVPSHYQSIEKRRRVKKALHTDSLTIAREMRDR